MPESHSCCGVGLRPLSIGHIQKLWRFDVSFVNPASSYHGIGDLLLAVLICSRTHEEFQSIKDIEKEVKQWRNRLNYGIAGWIGRRVRKLLSKEVTSKHILGIDLEKEAEAFQCYMDAHGCGLSRINDWSRPATRSNYDSKSGGIIRSPEWFLLLTALLSDFNMPLEKALDLPIAYVRWLSAAKAERSGQVSVVDVDELTEDKRLADEFAKKVLNGTSN